ncbi:MAG: hypothetical protein IKE74_10255 [Mogibacterium sp.]|nr:hypothetical protein [Mogibacterium sp.]
MQIRIDYNNHHYNDNAVYITAGYNNGIASKYYKVDDEIAICNLSFSHLIVNYIKKKYDLKCDCQIGQTSTCFTIKSNKEEMVKDLTTLIDVFRCLEFDRSLFDEVKETALENFKEAYKNGEFRARYKAMEIADITKGYTFEGLIRDMTSIGFEEFTSIGSRIIINGELMVYVNGNLRNLTDDELASLNDRSEPVYSVPEICGKEIDPYLLDDAHIIETARESYNIDVIHFAFNDNISLIDRYVWTNIETARIQYEDKEVNVDELDASVIVSTPELISLKKIFRTPIDNEQFNKAKGSIFLKYRRLLEKKPVLFNQDYVGMKLAGCSLIDFLELLDRLEYEGYLNVSEKIKPIINEGQVALRREVFNV